jgi:hypothetical protein
MVACIWRLMARQRARATLAMTLDEGVAGRKEQERAWTRRSKHRTKI